MEDIGSRVGYIVLWAARVRRGKPEALMSYYPGASPTQVMAVLSGIRVVRILCGCVATPCCRVAGVGYGMCPSVFGDDL